jgi:hypothetical protein
MTSSRRRLTNEAARRLTLAADPWLSCDECFEHLDTFVEQILTGNAPVRPAMRAHLRGCAACEEEARSLLLLVADDLRLDAGTALHALAGY